MLIGNTINIRHLQPGELDAWIAAKNDAATMGEFTTFQVTSPVIVQNEFAQNGLSSEAMETFAIVGKFDQLIGTICHFPATGYASAREIGFSIFANEFRNQGIATEAVALLVQYLFHTKPINRLQIVMPVQHQACEKIALKSGFTKEGVARGLLFIRGEYCDCNVYALLRSEFNNIQENKN